MTTNREWLSKLAHEDPHALAEWFAAERAMDDAATEEQLRGTANRPNGESADRETPETSEIGASKDEIRVFDVWNVAYKIYRAGGYVDNGDEPNPPTDGIRELLDRQAAITREEVNHVAGIAAHEAGKILREQIDELEAERDELREKLSVAIGHAVDILALQDLNAVDKEGEVTA